LSVEYWYEEIVAPDGIEEVTALKETLSEKFPGVTATDPGVERAKAESVETIAIPKEKRVKMRTRLINSLYLRLEERSRLK
jgi:hypothetical protein